jgi:mRNA interferase MazF
MGQYVKGDVLLVPVALEDRALSKTRPVVVIGTEEHGRIHICPVSSKPPSDAPCIQITLDDFSEGGLDLFGESYVMTSRVLTIRSGDVIGKKGRLTAEPLAEIARRVSAALQSSPAPVKKTGRSPKRRSPT